MIGKRDFIKIFDNNPRLLVFAGPNSSGKSSVTRRIDKHKILPKLYVNPDDIAREKINYDQLFSMPECEPVRKSLLRQNQISFS